MNPYSNYTLKDLITVISDYKYIENTGIQEVCEMASSKLDSERDSILFVRTLRKYDKYDQANKYHEKLKTKYPNSSGLKSEALWLEFSSKVCDAENMSFKDNAQHILDETSQTNPETKL